MAQIELGDKATVFIDDHNYDMLMSLGPWHLKESHGMQYAYGWEKPYVIRQKPIIMHRIIMQTPSELDVHHLDGNGLNNYENNLINVSRSIHALLRRTTGGCTWVSDKNRWKAQIMYEGKRKFLGYFRNREEAEFAYESAKIEILREALGKDFERIFHEA